jgi:C-terminal processing protease CtpA/Prc
MISLSPNQRVDIDVPVVGWDQGTSWTMSGLGADFDDRVLVPALVRVKPRGPAAVAGFADGDVVTTVDGIAVADLSPRGVLVLVVNRAPGTKVQLAGMRGDKAISGEVTLGPSH